MVVSPFHGQTFPRLSRSGGTMVFKGLVQPDNVRPGRQSIIRRTRSRRHAVGSSPIRILIVDNYEVIRQGIRAILQPALDIEVVGEASDAEEAIRLVCLLTPDVVIMEVFLRGANGPTVAA